MDFCGVGKMTALRLQGCHGERMKGLEPSAFCMASGRTRSRPFAAVRSTSLFAGDFVGPIERHRTWANDECDHRDHAGSAPNASIEPEAELRPPRVCEAGKRAGGDARIGVAGER